MKNFRVDVASKIAESASGLSLKIQFAPFRYVHGQQRFEQPTVVWNAEMEKLMHDNEVLKRFVASGQVGSEGDCAESGT